jgi:hypothetical protein
MDVFERVSASQTLLSQRTTNALGLLGEQDFRDALRGHLDLRFRLVSTADQRQLDSPRSPGRGCRLSRETPPQQLCDRVFELAVLFDGLELEVAHQVIGKLEGRLHPSQNPIDLLFWQGSGRGRRARHRIRADRLPFRSVESPGNREH